MHAHDGRNIQGSAALRCRRGSPCCLSQRCWGCSLRGSPGPCPCDRSRSRGPLRTGVSSRRRSRTGIRSLANRTSSSTPSTLSCPSAPPARAPRRRCRRRPPPPCSPPPQPPLPSPPLAAPFVPSRPRPPPSGASSRSTLSNNSPSWPSRRSRSRPSRGRWQQERLLPSSQAPRPSSRHRIPMRPSPGRAWPCRPPWQPPAYHRP
mmetsp:Transcript_64842/g.193232  ORF Transcript_64842/g.193232 Transcript_64842/m.193232 type:complete len:205 (+) Transcript_64842:2-616(+)